MIIADCAINKKEIYIERDNSFKDCLCVSYPDGVIMPLGTFNHIEKKRGWNFGKTLSKLEQVTDSKNYLILKQEEEKHQEDRGIVTQSYLKVVSLKDEMLVLSYMDVLVGEENYTLVKTLYVVDEHFKFGDDFWDSLEVVEKKGFSKAKLEKFGSTTLARVKPKAMRVLGVSKKEAAHEKYTKVMKHIRDNDWRVDTRHGFLVKPTGQRILGSLNSTTKKLYLHLILEDGERLSMNYAKFMAIYTGAMAPYQKSTWDEYYVDYEGQRPTKENLRITKIQRGRRSKKLVN